MGYDGPSIGRFGPSIWGTHGAQGAWFQRGFHAVTESGEQECWSADLTFADDNPILFAGRITGSGAVSDYLRVQKERVKEHIGSVSRLLVMNVPQDAVLEDTVAKFRVEPLEIDRDAMVMDKSDTQVDVSSRRDRVIPDRLRSGPVLVPGVRMVVSLPYTGDAQLWELTPSTFSTTFPHGNVRSPGPGQRGHVEFVLEGPTDDPPDQFKGLLDSQLADIERYLGWQREELDAFNDSLPEFVGQVIQQWRERLGQGDGIAEHMGIPVARRDEGGEVARRPQTPDRLSPSRTPVPEEEAAGPPKDWDVFICHASEDKDAIARPLAEALQSEGLSVWYDEFSMTVGDSLRRKIDHGIARSRYGVVVLSPTFFAKEWPQRELDGLAALEVSGSKVILPVWHEIDRDGVAAFSPTLADRLAVPTSLGLPKVVEKLLAAVRE